MKHWIVLKTAECVSRSQLSWIEFQANFLAICLLKQTFWNAPPILPHLWYYFTFQVLSIFSFQFPQLSTFFIHTKRNLSLLEHNAFGIKLIETRFLEIKIGRLNTELNLETSFVVGKGRRKIPAGDICFPVGRVRFY